VVSVLDAVEKVQELLDHYRHYNGSLVTPVNVMGRNGLVHVMELAYGLPVEVGILPWEARYLKGCVLRYGRPGRVERAEIYCPASMSVPWTRFVICKEMAHLLLDGPDSFTDDPVTMAAALIDSPVFARVGQGAPEYAFAVAATEMLIPWQRRYVLGKFRWGFKGRDKVARHFAVPEEVAELRTGRGYRRMIERHYRDIEAFAA
jgi:hypothetical protein